MNKHKKCIIKNSVYFELRRLLKYNYINIEIVIIVKDYIEYFTIYYTTGNLNYSYF